MSGSPLVQPPLEPTAEVLQILEAYLEELERGSRPHPDALLARHPHLAEPLRACLASLDLLHDAAQTLRGPGPASACELSGKPPELRQLGEFRLLREIGRGGMGVVYEAEQLSLQRRVALKVLPSGAALDAKQLHRFKVEAQAAAHLRHAHIVPVHAVGCEQGVHYYAMQYIEGQSLADLIRELRGLAGLDPVPFELGPGQTSHDATAGQAPPAASETTAVGAGTTRTSSPAKDEPSTIVCGLTQPARGPAFFRRAAELGIQAAEALEHAHEQGILHRDIKPANLLLDQRGNLWVTDFGLARFQTDAGVTLSGDLLGTIRYMSPEQALAKRGLVDHRTDVYSLGVTLYELVTLQPAFSGRDRQELLRQIAFEEPRPPRQLNRELPIDLETILGKAIAKDPTERYATAQDLAEDLRRFLDDRPILARRPGLVQRSARWAQRHKPLVGVALLLLVLVGVGSAISACLIWRAKRQTDAAYAAKAEQHRRMEENLQLALQALEEIYLQVVERRFAHNPQKEEDRELLRKALTFYEHFAQKNSNNSTVWRQAAMAYLRVGNIRQKLGHHEEARDAHEQAVRLLEKVAADWPSDLASRHALAANYNSLGKVLWDMGRIPEAQEAYRKALALHAQLATDQSYEFPCRREQAACYNNLGLLLRSTGRLDEAEKAFRQALELDEKLVADFPNQPEALYQLAGSHHSLALLLEATGRIAEAEKSFRYTLGVLEKLARAFPGNAEYRQRLATARHNLGVLLQETAVPLEPASALRAALDLQACLARDFPSFWACVQDLARTWQVLADLVRTARRLPEAEACFLDAQQLLEKLARDYPNVPAYRRELAVTLNHAALLLSATRRPHEAEAAYRRALRLHEELARTACDGPEYRHELAACWNNLGLLLEATGRVAEAEEAFRRALAAFRKLASDLPATPEYASNLGATMSNLARVLCDRGELAQARALAAEAVLHQQAALRCNPGSQAYRQLLRTHYRVLADTLLRLGTAAETAQVAEQLAASEGGWETAFHAGAILARCVPLAHGSGDAATYAERARTLLQQAQAQVGDDSVAQNTLALFLANCPDARFRDLNRALALAQRAVARGGYRADPWYTLGVVLYRQGRWCEAVEALQRAVALRTSAEGGDWLFLAMSHWQQGNRAQAYRCYGRAAQALKQVRCDEDVRRAQAEAAALLGVERQARLRRAPIAVE